MLDSKPLILSCVGVQDVDIAVGQYTYLAEKHWTNDFNLLISADTTLTSYDVWRLVKGGGKAFKGVQVVQPPFNMERGGKLSWSNWMIQTAVVRKIKDKDAVLLLLPVDAMPVIPEWRNRIYIGDSKIINRPYPTEMTVVQWLKKAGHNSRDWFIRSRAKGVEILPGSFELPTTFNPSIGSLVGPPVAEHFRKLSRQVPQVHASPKRKRLVIRRWAAIGDVIASTAVARVLNRVGYEVDMVTVAPCAEALLHCSSVASASEHGTHQVNLDLAYENEKDKDRTHIHDLFFRRSNIELEKFGLSLGTPVNCAPELHVTTMEFERAQGLMEKFQRPWVIACSRSHMVARTVPSEIIAAAAPGVKGTVFWGSNTEAPDGVVDLGVRKIRDLMGFIARSDLVLSIDSAPLHIAAGLRKPVLAIRQSFDPRLRISEQRDMTVFQRSELPCIPCSLYACHINREKPPCATLPVSEFVEAITKKLASLFGNTTSAIIPVYKPNVERLNICLRAILPQVNEVVIGIDGDGVRPVGIVASPKIKWVSHYSKKRRGYGKTCNLAASESYGRYLLMLNDDCFATADMVRVMTMEMELNAKTGVVGGLLRYPNGKIQHGGTVRGETNFYHLDHNQINPTVVMPRDMEFVTFAAAMVRRETFYDIDGFDERYDCYGEDSDFCLRAGQKGWKVRYNPNVKAIHQESQTSSPMKRELLESGNRVFQSIWSKK